MNNEIKEAFDRIVFSEDLEEKAAAILRSPVKTENNMHAGRKTKKIILVAAVAAIFTAAAAVTGIAISRGGFAQISEIAEENANTKEEANEVIKDVKFPSGADIDAKQRIGNSEITLDTMWIYTQDAPNYVLECEFTYTDADMIKPTEENIVLTADGEELKQASDPAGYMDDSGKKHLSLRYEYPSDKIVNKAFAFSGTLHTYDSSGAVTGELGMFDISFKITKDMLKAHSTRRENEMFQLLQEVAEYNAENVTSFVEPWQYIGCERDDVQVVEVGYSDGFFCAAGKGITCEIYINGRFITQYENGVYAQDGDSSLSAYRWKVDPSEMTDDTVIGLPYFHKDSGEYRMIYLKYNEGTGEFAAPADETEYAALKEKMDNMIRIYEEMENRRYSLSFTDTVGDVTVRFTNFIIGKDGRATLVFSTQGHHDRIALYRSAPKIEINGKTYFGEEERLYDNYRWYDDNRVEYGMWTFHLDSLAEEMLDTMQLSVEWDIYDTDFLYNLVCKGHISTTLELNAENMKKFSDNKDGSQFTFSIEYGVSFG